MRIGRLRSSLMIRVTAAWLSGTLLGGGAVVAHASSPPPKPSPQSSVPSTPMANRALRTLKDVDTPLSALVWTVPVIPQNVSWISNTAADPWTLFDGAARPVLAAASTPTNWTLSVTLDRRSPLTALTLRGPARGTLSVLTKDDSGLHPVPEWTQRALVAGAEWQRLELVEPVAASQIVLRWQAENDSSPTELGVWARRAEGPASSAKELADQLLMVPPADAVQSPARPAAAQVAQAATSGIAFRAHVDRDPRVFGRAFLVYELANVGHWTQVERRINGLSRSLAAAPSPSGVLSQGGVQVEEISIDWLRNGDNEIRFFPSKATPYGVRNLRIVGVPHQRIETAQFAADRATEIGFDQPSQMHEIAFEVLRAGEGSLLVSGGKAKPMAIPLHGFEPGWHRYKLDERVALGATLSMPAPKKKTRNKPTDDTRAIVSKVAISASPALSDAAARLAIAYPLHSECANSLVMVRGFLDAQGDRLVALSANGRPIAVAGDSSFAAAVPFSAKDITIDATLATGQRLSRRLHVDRCFDRSQAAAGTVEDDGAPFAAVVRSGEAATLHFAGATLEIPKGAVDGDTRLTIRPLVSAQLAPMTDGIANVSPEGYGFRFGPHGMKFKKPVRITLPYDRTAMLPGSQEREIFGFYYDEPQHKWVRVGRFGIAENGALASLSEHFTDFINATIAMPDQPGAKSFSTTEMSGIKLASPSAGIDLIAPPVPNSAGDARLQLPIEVPPGRNGLQPSLAFTYGSSHGNGWLGEGWGLDLPAIEIDTRYGVPDYGASDFITNSAYALNGEEIVPSNSGDVDSFRRRVEGRFDLIHRNRAAVPPGSFGCSEIVESWVVTDKNGTLYTYGGNGATLVDPGNDCHTFRWNLSSVRDTFGNVMRFSYFQDRNSVPVNGDPWVSLYPGRIDYTAHETTPGHEDKAASYSVVFGRSADVRPDVIVSGRSGFQTRMERRLDHVDVTFGDTVIRRYKLTYLTSDNGEHFHKSLLTSIALQGLDKDHGEANYAGRQLDEHTFDYYAARWRGSQLDAFTEMQPLQWGALGSDDRLSHSNDTSGGAGASIGVGLQGIIDFTVTAEGMGGDNDILRSMGDINGDGLPDLISNGGGIQNYLNGFVLDPSHLSPVNIDLTGSQNHTSMAGVNVHGGLSVLGGVVGAGVGYTQQWLTDDRILADIDADGLPDLVRVDKGKVWWEKNLGRGGGSTYQFAGSKGISNEIPASIGVFDQNSATIASSGGYDRIDPLVRWIAPFDGTITIGGPISKLKDGGTGVVASIFQCHGADKCASPQQLWSRTLTSAGAECVPSGNGDCGSGVQVSVSRGDRIFTLLSVAHDPNSPVSSWPTETLATDVTWDPSIVYQTSASNSALREPYNAPIYQFEQANDFSTVGNPPAPWIAHSAGTVHISGGLTKHTTSEDVTVKITLIPAGHDFCTAPASGAAPAPGPALARVAVNGAISATPSSAMNSARNAAFMPAVNPNMVALAAPATAGGGVLFSQTFAGDASFDSQQISLDVDVQPNDELVFEVVPGTTYAGSSTLYPGLPIDPGQITWLPSVAYTSMCRTDSNTGQEICGAVKCLSTTNSCHINGDDVDAKYPRAAVFQSPRVFQHVTPLVQQTGATKPYIVPADGTITLNGGFSVPADVDVMIQGVNRLYFKQHSHTFGELINIDNLKIDAKQGDEIFVTLYSPLGQTVFTFGGVRTDNNDVLPVNFVARDLSLGDEVQCKSTDDPMSGGHHGWYYGYYDGENAFDERQVGFPYDADQKLIKAYRLALPAAETVAIGDQAVPVWAGAGGAYIAVSSGKALQRPTRTANGGASPSSGPGGSDSLRHAITWNFDVSAAAGISVNWDHGQTEADHDFFDFNGDHYPDHVDNGGTVSFLRIPKPDHPENAYFEARPVVGLGNTFDGSDNNGNAVPLRVIDHGTIAIGFGDNRPIANKTDPSGNRSTSVSLGFTASGKYGVSSTSTDWIDVNGDGLPDQVQRVPSGDPNNPFVVKLNYGYRLGSPMKAAAANWDTSNLHYGSTVEDDLNQAFGSVGLLNFAGSHVGLNAIRAQDSGGFAGSLSAGAGNGGSSSSYSGGVGVGFNYTASRTLIDLIDMNGDGLPDQVMKLPGEDAIHIRLNRGADFDPNEISWYLPAAWPAASGESSDDGIYAQLGPIGDALTYDRAKSFNVGVDVKYCFWFVCVGVDAFYANADTYGDMRLQDIDGDGLPDMVLKRPNDTTIYVKRNRLNSDDNGNAHPVNVLSTVHRPLGSTIKLTYTRMGNNVTPTAWPTRPTIDMPTTKYVMNSVDVDDNFGNHYTQTFHHNADGFYDRLERDDYGFATVITSRIDNSTGQAYTVISDDYLNHSFYEKGLRTQSITRDPSLNVWTSELTSYAQPDDATANAIRSGSFFPSKQSETTSWYEGQTTDPYAPPKSRTSVYSKYDSVGNLTDFIEYNDDGADDDVFYHVDYSNDQTLLSQHIYRASDVQAHSVSPTGPLLRDRQASYERHGALQTLTNILVGGKDPTSGQPYTGATNPTWTFSYDAYGNVIQDVDPRQYTLTYTYDDTAQTYRTQIADSFGLTSTSMPNYAFGAPQVVTDTNDNTEVYAYDEFGRTSTVYGPNDVPAPDGTDFCSANPPTSNEPTIAFCYSRRAIDPTSPIPPTPPSQPEYATTRHKDTQHTGDPVVTSTFVDGLGRVIQTKKDLDRDIGTGTQTGMTVSGTIAFDGLGRLIAQDQPVFDPSGDPTAYYRPTAPPGHITRFTYDVLDRKTSATTPDGALTKMTYGFDKLDGVLRLSTVTSDANVNSGAPWGTDRETFTDFRGLVFGVLQHNRVNKSSTPTALLTRYQYDGANELVKVTDAKGNVTTAEYDSVGHMVALTSPDAGRTEWRYDLSGNVGAKETANLRKQGQLILYDHQFNRLRTIVYPVSPAVSYVYGDSGERGAAFANVAGRVKREISEAGQRDYQYDRLGNIAQEHWLLHSIKWAPGTDYEHTTGYTHDSFGRLLTVDFGDSSHEVVSYNYDHGGNVTNVVGASTNPQGATTYVSQVGYDEFEARTRLAYGNGIVATYQYDPLTRRLTNINADERDPTLVSQNLPARPFQRLVYGYDLVGNVTQVRNDAPFDDSMKGVVLLGTVKQNFTYDDLYQLKTGIGSYQETSGSHNDYTLEFNYDEIGNILQKTQTNGVVSGKGTNPILPTTYDSSYTYGGSRPHAPTEIDETAPQGNKTTVFQRSLSYDDDGNQAGWLFANNQHRQTTWNEEDRIQSVTSNNVELARALYNGDGERAVNWQNDNPWYEISYFGANVTLRNGSYTTRHVFLGDTRIASRIDDQRGGKTPTTVYFHDDQLGSTNFLTDGSQQPIEHEEYLPSGELWVDESDRRFLDRPAYLFNGKELDSGTNLFYFGARYYDPHLSQWASADPILDKYVHGEVNKGVYTPINLALYSYSANTPVSAKDPNGRNWFKVDGTYQFHPGDTYNGQKSTYTHFVEFVKTGGNELGAATGTLTLYNQNTAVARSEVFSGGVARFDKQPAPDGTYTIDVTQHSTASWPFELARTSEGVELAPTPGLQEIPPIIARYEGAQSEWGTMRARLMPDPGERGERFQNLYIHGKLRPLDDTHGCICNRDETVLKSIFNLNPGQVPKLPVQVRTAAPAPREKPSR